MGRAVAAEPQDRYQSAGAFEASLARFLGAAPHALPVPSPWTRVRLAIAAGALALVVAVGVGYRLIGPGSPQAGRDGSVGTSVATGNVRPSSAPVVEPGSYRIDTALYRASDDGQEVRLRSGARVAPNDRLFVEVRTSVPAYVYIVNEDEHGESYLLFPLPGQNVTNPLPAGQANRLPGVRGNQDVYWLVDKAGGREHFLIFASPERLPTVERMLASLPHPEIGRPVESLHLPREAVTTLRSVGGLATAPGPQPQSSGQLTREFPTPLADNEETARGLWVRQLTLDNPTK